MPVYQFKIIEQASDVEDVLELELTDDAAARGEARETLADLAHALPKADVENAVTLQVTSPAGELIYKAWIAFGDALPKYKPLAKSVS